MNLHVFLKFGYVFVVGIFLLMVWVSLSSAREISDARHPPCFFNSLCSCSKSVPDLGIVRCQNVNFPRIPATINGSKVFMLHMENNGLLFLEPYFLQYTGLYKLTISDNPIYFIPDEAFVGLERSLWELDLSNNELIKVPNRAIRYLQKLRHLDLTGNNIYEIKPDNWRGLENSLVKLILSNNAIKSLPMDGFSGLPLLETLDLSGNNLREIDPSVFRDGMGRLAHLILADNQLSTIPYEALTPLSALKTLDLSENLINTLQPTSYDEDNEKQYNFRISLDEIRLDKNQIFMLEPGSFQYFDVLNKTYLDKNNIQEIKDSAFRVARIRELYLRNCGIKEIDPDMFAGLEGSLTILDLSGNKISTLQQNEFHRFENLRNLNLNENSLAKVNPIEAFNGFQYTLYNLDLGGTGNEAVNIQDLRRLRSLRTLSLPRLSNPDLKPEDFEEFGMDLQEIIISSSNLKTIKNHAFQHVHSVKLLDISENTVKKIEPDAFVEIGHSLRTLKMSRSLSSSVQILPGDALKHLINLRELDLSNNRIRTMPDTSFHFLKKLSTLQLQDNVIEQLHKGTFQGDIHSNLQSIYLSFNNIRSIQQHTFVDLPVLEQLHLDDNKIDSLERRSFMNLENLVRLNLKGNRISSMSYETFQNLPELEDLDISYNRLKLFEFSALDQVGTLGNLQVNVSHNYIIELTINSGLNLGPENVGGVHSNIKVLDLSFNNISYIPKQFFQPATMSLTHLHLCHNQITNATKDAFGNLPHLEWLDLSHNKLIEINFDMFRNTRKVQVFLASHNDLSEVPVDLFRYLTKLRVVDLSHNELRFLPENFFKEEGLERLDLSHNSINRLPLISLSTGAASTLCELDLSWNGISSIADAGLFSKFKSLALLDLSYNRLVELDAGAFSPLSSLVSLDLSHNTQLIIDKNGLTFQGLEDSLLHLKLDNVSLTYIPELTLPSLVTLSLAYNLLPTVPPEMATNISSLRFLNLDKNDLTAIPVVTHSLAELQTLSLNDNPITSLSNTSLLGIAEHLSELDIANLDLTVFENGALAHMSSLRTLKLSTYDSIHNFNIPKVLENNRALRNLDVHVSGKSSQLGLEMFGDFPPKLRSLSFSGRSLKTLDKNVLKGMKFSTLHLRFYNTSVNAIPVELFRNMGDASNISLEISNNLELKHIENPSADRKPGLPRKPFLIDIQLLENKLSCDCSLGWIEVWMRKKRQYLCGHAPSKPSHYSSSSYTCRHPSDNLRNTVCVNKGNKTLIEVLKSDIECGWSSGIISQSWNMLLLAAVLISSLAI